MTIDSLKQEIEGLKDQREALEAKLEAIDIDIASCYNDLEQSLCDSCAGMGCIDIGDCDDGVTEVCNECEGKGFIDE